MRDSTVLGRGGVQGYHCTAARGWGSGTVPVEVIMIMLFWGWVKFRT